MAGYQETVAAADRSAFAAAEAPDRSGFAAVAADQSGIVAAVPDQSATVAAPPHANEFNTHTQQAISSVTVYMDSARVQCDSSFSRQRGGDDVGKFNSDEVDVSSDSSHGKHRGGKSKHST